MILQHYGLREQPFGATPDPRFLFASKIHREALASLVYAIESGRGFTALIAPPGLGKTTLLFHLLESMRGKGKTAFVFQSQCKPRELLRFLLKEFGVTSPTADFVAMHHALNDMLAAEAIAGRKCVIVLDEAHNLSDSVLESVRLLSDFETPSRKLLHIVMAGQLELRERLSQPSLAQLRQRIGVVCKLAPLPPKEIDEYIQHRLKAAAHSGQPLFTPAAMAVIREFSRGIPRNINALCFSAMSLGFALGRTELDAQILEEAVADLSLEEIEPQAFLDEPEFKDSAWQSQPASESGMAETVALGGSGAKPEEAPIPHFSAAVGADPQTTVRTNLNAPAADPAICEARPEPLPAAAISLPTTPTEAKAEEEPSRDLLHEDPLLNIDLSDYALLGGVPPKRKTAKVEEDVVDQNSPWAAVSPRKIVPEPELDLLKQRLANHSYPEEVAAGGMRRDFVIIGLIAAVFGTAVLAALLWARPNIGFAMGSSQPAQPTPASPTMAQAKADVSEPKQVIRERKADVSPLLVTSAVIKAPSRQSFELALAEESAPPPPPLDDPAGIQQPQGVTASPITQPLLSVENARRAEIEAMNTPTEMVPAVYPESAKQNRVEGTVVLQIVVDKNGKVKRLERISGDRELSDAAMEAVRHWRYQPSIVDGRRVESYKQVEMNFRLGESGAGLTPQLSTQE